MSKYHLTVTLDSSSKWPSEQPSVGWSWNWNSPGKKCRPNLYQTGLNPNHTPVLGSYLVMGIWLVLYTIILYDVLHWNAKKTDSLHMKAAITNHAWWLTWSLYKTNPYDTSDSNLEWIWFILRAHKQNEMGMFSAGKALKDANTW